MYNRSLQDPQQGLCVVEEKAQILGTKLVCHATNKMRPFLIVAAFTDRLTGRLRGPGRLGRRLHQGAGVVMILMGIAMITGQLSALSYWLLDVFPMLGKIG